MKLFPTALAAILLAGCLAACSPNQNAESIANDTTQIDAYEFAGMPENFAAFLGNFPIKPLPAKFPSDDTYSEGDLVAIDKAFVKEFLPVYDFDQDQNQLYYLASLRLHPDLYSVIIYHVGEMGSPSYMLGNFNGEGSLLSTRTVAYSEAGGGMTSWSTAMFDNGGRLTITDSEEGRTPDYTEKNVSTYQLNAAGAILPTGISPELLTSFHNAVLKKGVYLVAPAFGYSEVQLNSRSFEISQLGDSTLFSPYGFFESNASGLHELIVDSFTKTAEGFRFTLKEMDYPHDLYDALTHVTLNAVKSFPGVYQLVFSPAGSDYAVVTAAKPEFVIAETKLSSYKTRELPFIDGKNGISISGGLNRVRLETSKDSDLSDWAKEEGFTYKKDAESGFGDRPVYHSVFDRQEQVILQALADNHMNLVEIVLYSPLFKTDGGIGVGSTVGELLYAHEGVSAICGENTVMISIPDYSRAQFVVSHVAGAPDTELDVTSLDEKLEIVRVDFRLD